METLEQITTENLTQLKNTYRDIGDFYLSKSLGNGSISERFRKSSEFYMKRARNLDRLFEDGAFRGDNCYNAVSGNLEYAYYGIMDFDLHHPMLISINATISMVDKVLVKN